MLLFIGVAIFYFSSVFGIVLSQVGVDTLPNLLISLGGISGATYLYWQIYKLFSRYVFYLVKAAHIAVIVDYIQKGNTPKWQLVQGFRKMKDKFVSVSLLFVIDRVLDSILKEAHKKLMKFGDWAKLPKPLTYILSGTVNTAINYVDESIIAYIFAHKDQDVWKAAKDGLVLYVKNWMWILLTAGILSIVVYGTMALSGVYIYFEGIPFSSLNLILQSIYSVLTVGIIIILYSGLVQPFIEISVIVTFMEEIKNQSPDSKTLDWLKSQSKRFGTLLAKATGSLIPGS